MIPTLMEHEAREAPERIAEQLSRNAPLIAGLRSKLATLNPRYVVVIARGSSDHAGLFAKYLIEIEKGLPVVGAAPSVTTAYGRALHLRDALVIAISQSGRSPDILATTAMARGAGAYCIALVNDENSPLATQADFVLPLRVGAERAIAATKSYLASLSALLQFTAAWSGNVELLRAIQKLPEHLARAIAAPPQLTSEHLEGVDHLVVLGRGLGFAIGKEIALKLNEVCRIQAECYSSAEFLHGPIALLNRTVTAIDVSIADEAREIHQARVEEVRRRGGHLVHLHQVLGRAHARVAPLLLLQRFYIDVARAAVNLGLDPDRPTGLQKVTETV